ncbi:hypothetical protein [Brachybacterium kimchii]|nr:hypothetical protein [Brachybacterium kimchii]
MTKPRRHRGTPHKTARAELRALKARLSDYHRPTHKKEKAR